MLLGAFLGKAIQTMFHRIPASFPFERASRSMLTPGFFLMVFQFFYKVFLLQGPPKIASIWIDFGRRLGAVLGSILEASWRDFGGVLEASWRVLGVSWGLLGESGGILGASWGVLARLGWSIFDFFLIFCFF